MPTYDYTCTACGHAWELFQSMSAKPEKACPSCGRRTAKRLIGTGAALLFKGSGFYETDYRSASYKKAAEADKPAGAAESKPAASSGSTPVTEAKPKAESAAQPKAEAKPVAEKKPSKKKGS